MQNYAECLAGCHTKWKKGNDNDDVFNAKPSPPPPTIPSPWATLVPSVPRFGRPWIALQTLGSPFFSREQHKCEEKGRERGKIKEELGWQQGRRQGGWGLGGSLPADTSRFSQPASTPHPMVFMHFISRRWRFSWRFYFYYFVFFFSSRSLLGFVYDFFSFAPRCSGFLFLFGFRFGIGQMYLYLYLYLYMWRCGRCCCSCWCYCIAFVSFSAVLS